MEGITLAELSIYLSINASFLGAAWMLVRHGTRETREMIAAHSAAERNTLTMLQEAAADRHLMLDDVRERIRVVEERLKQQPTHEDMYRIGIGVERLIARLDAQDKIIARLDTITQRQEDYLVSRSR